jgi:hypothetical protein
MASRARVAKRRAKRLLADGAADWRWRNARSGGRIQRCRDGHPRTGVIARVVSLGGIEILSISAAKDVLHFEAAAGFA